jgi:hypothetical protein
VRDGGGSGGSGSDYKSFNGPAVNVDIKDLTSYYKQMELVQTDATGPATMELTPMAQMIRVGLSKPGDTGAGVFPEGAYAAELLMSRQSDFQHFMHDVLNGIRNIGSAAAVIAEVYENADSESAAGLGDIGFAFSDPTAKPPAGFRKVESWSEYEQRMAQQRGELPMSATGDDSQAKVIYPASGVAIYLYPDGSSKQVTTTTTTSPSQYRTGSTITTTTAYAPGGKVISTTTDEKYGADGGAKVQKTTTNRGDDQNGSASTTSTVTDSGGKVTVTNETTTRTDGRPNTTTSKPVTITPGNHTESGGAGPVEQAENQVDTRGQDWYVKQFGRGY